LELFLLIRGSGFSHDTTVDLSKHVPFKQKKKDPDKPKLHDPISFKSRKSNKNEQYDDMFLKHDNSTTTSSETIMERFNKIRADNDKNLKPISTS
jgi:hypothetical protein